MALNPTIHQVMGLQPCLVKPGCVGGTRGSVCFSGFPGGALEELGSEPRDGAGLIGANSVSKGVEGEGLQASV